MLFLFNVQTIYDLRIKPENRQIEDPQNPLTNFALSKSCSTIYDWFFYVPLPLGVFKALFI